MEYVLETHARSKRYRGVAVLGTPPADGAAEPAHVVLYRRRIPVCGVFRSASRRRLYEDTG